MSKRPWVKVLIVKAEDIEFLDSDEEGGVGTVEYYQPKPRKRVCLRCRKELPGHLEGWMKYHPQCYSKLRKKSH